MDDDCWHRNRISHFSEGFTCLLITVVYHKLLFQKPLNLDEDHCEHYQHFQRICDKFERQKVLLIIGPHKGNESELVDECEDSKLNNSLY